MPYTVGHPVQSPSDFYGRVRQIAQLFETIGGAHPQSANVIALPRSGKTSFLRQIAHPSVMVRHVRQPERLVMVYVDMASSKTPGQFYYRILTQLKMSLGQVHTGFLWKESPPEQTSIYDVEAFLCHFPLHRIVLLLDDFDALHTDTFDRRFLTELRAMTSVNDYDLVCVTTTRTDLHQISSRVGLPATSPFFNIFSPTPIYLAEVETAVIDPLITQPALQAGLPFSAADVQQIQRLAGTLPFMLQLTAARWLYHKRLDGSPDAGVVQTQLVAELSPCFSQWWAQFDACQQQLLTELAAARPISCSPFSHFTIAEAERRLRQLGVVVDRRRGTAVNGGIFATWVRQQTAVPLHEMADAIRDTAVTPAFFST
ncbi:MAG TPA: AAA family ATPase [Chloroflexota bacterium]|nr:AAA family ATPase [Chloroflexota bacterium]HUM69120.1 AAA family ATPase [Chloroflexota bacterium]